MTVVAVVGAPGSGKTTLSQGLARHLGTPVVCVDGIRRRRARKWGYSNARADRIFDESGSEALHRYDSKFELFVLEEVVAETPAGIIDCSGGLHLQYTDEYRTRLVRALARVDSVIVTTTVAGVRGGDVQMLIRRLCHRGDDPIVREWIDRGGRRLLSRLEDAAMAVTHPDLHKVVAADEAVGVAVARLGGRFAGRYTNGAGRGSGA